MLKDGDMITVECLGCSFQAQQDIRILKQRTGHQVLVCGHCHKDVHDYAPDLERSLPPMANHRSVVSDCVQSNIGLRSVAGQGAILPYIILPYSPEPSSITTPCVSIRPSFQYATPGRSDFDSLDRGFAAEILLRE